MRLLLVVLLASIAAQSACAEPGWWGDFVSSVKESLSKVAEKAKDLYKKAKDFPILDEALRQLEKDFAKNSGGMLATALGVARKFVDTLEMQVQDLLKLVDEKLETVSIFIARAVLKEASGLNKWANATLGKFEDPAKRAKAEKIVEKFMNKSMEKINRCAKDVGKPIRGVYKMANETAVEATKIARNAVNTIENCAKGNDAKECLKKLPSIFEEGKDLIYAKILPMKSQLKSIASSASVTLSTCIATAKITIEINKSSVERMLKSLKSAPWSDGGGSCRKQRAPRIAEIQRQQTMDVEVERMGTTGPSTSNSSTTTATKNTFPSSTFSPSGRPGNATTSPTSYGSDSSTNSNQSTLKDSDSSPASMEAGQTPPGPKPDAGPQPQVTLPRQFEQLQLKTTTVDSGPISRTSTEPEAHHDQEPDADADEEEDEELKVASGCKHPTGGGGCVRKDVSSRMSEEAVTTAQKGSQTDPPKPRTNHPPRVMIPKLQSLESRPIYPNVPYSPYGSPFGSPRSNRRRTPLRESRRVSIEQSGSFLQLNQYKLMDQIGQGSYGLVKLAYNEEDSTHYAMKILSKRRLLRKAGLMGRGPKKTTSPLDRVYREIAVLKKLDHPNVVKLVEVLDDPLEDSLYLVFELVKQGEVLSVPTEQPLSEERAWCVFRDALQGLEYLHYQRIIHGDIKPGNLLLGEFGRVKIADLGVCNEFFGEDAAMNNGSTAGTPAFRAPETLIPGQHLYSGKAADIWALGATLYALIYGNVPFVANSVPAVYEKIKNDQLKLPEQPAISPELRDLLERILTKDPSRRITLPQIKEHPWLTANGACCLPSEEENCRLVQISDEDIHTVVKSIPKLDTLILIKTMLKNHSFQNPFSKAISGRAPQRGGSRLERFTRAGRSNSAPGAYHMSERQLSSDSILPAVSETVASSCNESSDQSLEG